MPPARTEILTGGLKTAVKKTDVKTEEETKANGGRKLEIYASLFGDGSGNCLYKIVLMLLQTFMTFIISLFTLSARTHALWANSQGTGFESN